MTDLRVQATADDGASESGLGPVRTRRSALRSVKRAPLVVGVVVVATLLAPIGAWPLRNEPPIRPAAPVTLVGLISQRTERLAYDPGATRAWASSPEVHSVVVVSGRITVYGPAGERQVYGQGQGFAAGWAPYRTTNETGASAETLVTFHVGPR
jgi:hypothetical protein